MYENIMNHKPINNLLDDSFHICHLPIGSSTNSFSTLYTLSTLKNKFPSNTIDTSHKCLHIPLVIASHHNSLRIHQVSILTSLLAFAITLYALKCEILSHTPPTLVYSVKVHIGCTISIKNG